MICLNAVTALIETGSHALPLKVHPLIFAEFKHQGISTEHLEITPDIPVRNVLTQDNEIATVLNVQPLILGMLGSYPEDYQEDSTSSNNMRGLTGGGKRIVQEIHNMCIDRGILIRVPVSSRTYSRVRDTNCMLARNYSTYRTLAISKANRNEDGTYFYTDAAYYVDTMEYPSIEHQYHRTYITVGYTYDRIKELGTRADWYINDYTHFTIAVNLLLRNEIDVGTFKTYLELLATSI